MLRCSLSIFPFRCGWNASSRCVATHNAASASVTATAANSRPRSIRTACETAPNAPRSGSATMPIRIAVSTVPVCGVSAIAHPTSARVPSSITEVSHGRTAGPRGGRTRIGNSLWSISQLWLRPIGGRRRYTAAARRPSSPATQPARSPDVSSRA